MLNITSIPKRVMLTGALLLFALGFYFFNEQVLMPIGGGYHQPCCDAYGYMFIAEAYHSGGFFSIAEPSRTFGYPWVLSLLIKASSVLNLPVNYLIFLLQISVYWIAIFAAKKYFDEYSKGLSLYIYILLCLNIFVIPYSGIALTDSLYTSLSLLIILGIMRIESLQAFVDKVPAKWLFIGTLLLSLVIVIRPAAIWLAIPYFYMLANLVRGNSINIPRSVV